MADDYKKSQLDKTFLKEAAKKSRIKTDIDGTLTRADSKFTGDVRFSLKDSFNFMAKYDPRAENIFALAKEKAAKQGLDFDPKNPAGNSTTFIPVLHSVKELYPHLLRLYERLIVGDHYTSLETDKEFVKGYRDIKQDELYNISVYSNAPRVYAEKIAHNMGLSREEAHEFTKGARDTYSDNGWKPMNEPFGAMLEREKEQGFTADDMIYMEDKMANIKTAASFGVTCIHLNTTGKELSAEDQKTLDELGVPSVTNYGLALQELNAAKKEYYSTETLKPDVQEVTADHMSILKEMKAAIISNTTNVNSGFSKANV